MPKQTRRNHSAAFKAKVALEAHQPGDMDRDQRRPDLAERHRQKHPVKKQPLITRESLFHLAPVVARSGNLGPLSGTPLWHTILSLPEPSE